jgi:Arc/MetJ-type ribon-helix-helix transcriptional regulator
MESDRIVRIPLPVELVRRIDQLILSGAGGFQTRTDVFREGAQMVLDEYTHSGGPAAREYDRLAPDGDGAATGDESRLEETVIHAPAEPSAVIVESIAAVRGQLLFGLHNRDYPSLWALRQIADLTVLAPRELDECLRLVTAAAWRYAEKLSALDGTSRLKLTALFPTNQAKPQSADDAFRNFAIGGCATTGAGLVATGPLFEWLTCAVVLDSNQKVAVGLTDHGYRLLVTLDGLSLRLPHERTHSEAFFEYLQKFDPADWQGFEFALAIVAGEATRDELVEAFAGKLDDRQDQAATYAAGYIARAREWGLIEPKQMRGRYALTTFGEEVAANAAGVTQ